MGNGNDANRIALQTVNQRIGKAMKRQRSRVVQADPAQFDELAQEAKHPIEFISEILCCNERAFADVPIHGGIRIGVRLVAKADRCQFSRYGFLRGAES